jgi:hypothetical protein
MFSALIDSGCSHSFISSDIVSQYSIACTSLSSPLKLTLFDGSFSGYITHAVELLIKFSDMSSDMWTFLETTLSTGCDLALGLDWLCSRNPSIDWSNGSVSLGTLNGSIGTSSFTVYKPVMAASRVGDSLAPPASNPSDSDSVSKPCELQTSAPGEQSSEILPNVEVINASAFCSLIEEGPLVFVIVMPSIESLITATVPCKSVPMF